MNFIILFPSLERARVAILYIIFDQVGHSKDLCSTVILFGAPRDFGWAGMILTSYSQCAAEFVLRES